MPSEMASFDLQTFARENGWSAAGACSPEIPDERASYFQNWLKSLNGLGMQYLARRKAERLDPRLYFKDIKSILVFGLYYFPGWAKGEVKVSNYAWSKDYHLVLKEKLEQTRDLLQQKLGPFQTRITVDTAPLLEKVFAEKAGLGWQGKNTLLLNKDFGSYLFLGTLLTNLEIERFGQGAEVERSAINRCGNCTRCIEACPTDALSAYELDPQKCISYWNLEHRGAFDERTPKSFHGWIAGCDICQEVCPWNRTLVSLENSPHDLSRISKEDFEAEKNWSERIRDTALNYVPPENWSRNLERV